jgi:hypothetical protein
VIRERGARVVRVAQALQCGDAQKRNQQLRPKHRAVPEMTGKSRYTLVIPAASSPELLLHQARLFRRYCREPLDFIVVNDAKSRADPTNWWRDDIDVAIRQMSARLQLDEVGFPQEDHKSYVWERGANASRRAAEAIQLGFSLAQRRFPDQKIMIVDHDIFPIKEFSLDEMLGNAVIAGIPQARKGEWFKNEVSYLWTGLLLLDLPSLPRTDLIRFGCGFVRGVRTDTGGQLYHYLARFPRLSFRRIPFLMSCAWSLHDLPANLDPHLADFIANDPKNERGTFFSELYDGILFHLRAGSNWGHSAGEGRDVFSARMEAFLRSIARVGLDR